MFEKSFNVQFRLLIFLFVRLCVCLHVSLLLSFSFPCLFSLPSLGQFVLVFVYCKNVQFSGNCYCCYFCYLLLCKSTYVFFIFILYKGRLFCRSNKVNHDGLRIYIELGLTKLFIGNNSVSKKVHIFSILTGNKLYL